MNLLEDIIMVNRNSMKSSIKSFKNNWIIVFTGLVYSFLNIAMFIILGTFFTGVLSILAGFIIAIVSSSLISNYLYLLFNIINYDKITMDDFKHGFKCYLWKIYGVFFIAWLVSLFFSLIGGLSGTVLVSLGEIISIVILIALNPLPETIYQKYYSAFESVKYAFQFMKENWIHWIIPNAIFYFLLYLLTKIPMLDIFKTHLDFNFDFSIKGVAFYILGQALFSFIMIYRGHLYKILSTSTRRKRMYMNKFYD